MSAPLPFRLTPIVWESRPGRFTLTAVAHGVLRLVPGGEATYVDPATIDLSMDDAAGRMLRQNLRAPFKPRGDVVLVGHAYPPPGAEVDRVVVRLLCGAFDKAITVTGDRLWRREGARWYATPPRPFTQLPLSSERAALSAENPVGFDPSAIPMDHRLAMPNLEPASGSYSAIVGPVPPQAPSRSGLLSPAALGWASALDAGRAAGPAPEGFHFGFFQLAPLDQQLLELPLGSALVLENANPHHAILTSRLPAWSPALGTLDPLTGARTSVPLRCDTLWIDGDRGTVDVFFRGMIELARPDQLPPMGLELAGPPPRKPKSNHAIKATQSLMMSTQQGTLNTDTALPFGRAGATAPQPVAEPTEGLPGESYPPPPAPRRSITAELEAPSAASALPFGDAGTASLDPDDLEATRDALPDEPTDVRGGGGYTAPPPPMHDADSATNPSFADAASFAPTGSFTGGSFADPPSFATGILPLAPREVALSSAEPASLGALFADERTHDRPAKVLAPRGVAGAVPDIGPTPPPPLPDVFEEPPVEEVEEIDEVEEVEGEEIDEIEEPADTLPPGPADEHAEPLRIPPPPPAPAPPPSFVDEPTPPADAPEPAAPAAAAATDAAPVAAAAPPEPAGPRETLTLEECAAVRALLSMPGADRAAVLAAERLDDATFTALEREHLRAIDEAVKRSEASVLDRYDDAYVAAQDARRAAAGKPLDDVTYARLQVARESGQLATLLEELGVPRPELMRLDRVWRRRLAQDAALRERVEDEMERLRGEG